MRRANSSKARENECRTIGSEEGRKGGREEERKKGDARMKATTHDTSLI